MKLNIFDTWVTYFIVHSNKLLLFRMKFPSLGLQLQLSYLDGLMAFSDFLLKLSNRKSIIFAFSRRYTSRKDLHFEKLKTYDWSMDHVVHMFFIKD